jgi:hypothetical protein
MKRASQPIFHGRGQTDRFRQKPSISAGRAHPARDRGACCCRSESPRPGSAKHAVGHDCRRYLSMQSCSDCPYRCYGNQQTAPDNVASNKRHESGTWWSNEEELAPSCLVRSCRSRRRIAPGRSSNQSPVKFAGPVFPTITHGRAPQNGSRRAQHAISAAASPRPPTAIRLLGAAAVRVHHRAFPVRLPAE